MQEFINPKSMMTPGAAGAMMMFLVNGLLLAFPELPARGTALLLSFLIGSIIFTSQSTTTAPLWEKTAYWFVNSLIIFVIGFGATHMAANAAKQSAVQEKHASSLFISSAFADEIENAKPASKQGNKATEKALSKKELLELLEKERKEKTELQEQLEKSTLSIKPTDDNKPKQSSQFFKEW